MKAAWRGAAPAILASGVTVIAGLLCLLLSSLNSNRALGPVAARRHRRHAAGDAHLPAGAAAARRPVGVLAAGAPRRRRRRPPAGCGTRSPGSSARHSRAIWVSTTVVLARAHPRAHPARRRQARPDRPVHPADRLGGRPGGHRPALPGRPGQPGHHLHHGRDRRQVATAAQGVPGVAGVRRCPRRAPAPAARQHPAVRPARGPTPAAAEGGRRPGPAAGHAGRPADSTAAENDRAQAPRRRPRGARRGRRGRRIHRDRPGHRRRVHPGPQRHHPGGARW